MSRPDLDAIEARDSERLMDAVGRACTEVLYIEAAEDRHALVAYARELEATLANERGEGEPPVEGWRSILYNGRPRWGIDFTDDDFVVVKQVYNSIEWTFLHNHPDGRVTRVDGFQSARAAMRAASVPS